MSDNGMLVIQYQLEEGCYEESSTLL